MIDYPIVDAADDSAAGTAQDLPTPVSVDDLPAFSTAAADLADDQAMDEAWR